MNGVDGSSDPLSWFPSDSVLGVAARLGIDVEDGS